jgi:farnesyl-diphosphate farnesyltransferase
LAALIQGGVPETTAQFRESFARLQRNEAEKALITRLPELLDWLHELAPADRDEIRNVLVKINRGQALDLERFGEGSEPRALGNAAELDEYTYLVAGCVGEFWTRLCFAHVENFSERPETEMRELGVRYGQGLQLTNILRDAGPDLRQGRCYLPADKLAEAGLTPADLLSPVSIGKLRPHYDRYLDRAEAHLAAGWNYTNTIPRGQMRVRLACAWPVLIGVKTLQRLRTENVLDGKQRVKVSRSEVRQIMLQSLLRYPFDAAWRKLAAFPTRQR